MFCFVNCVSSSFQVNFKKIAILISGKIFHQKTNIGKFKQVHEFLIHIFKIDINNFESAENILRVLTPKNGKNYTQTN